MLSATASASIRAAEGQGVPAMLQIGRILNQRGPSASDKARCGPSAMRLPFPKGMIGAILPPSTSGQPRYLGNID